MRANGNSAFLLIIKHYFKTYAPYREYRLRMRIIYFIKTFDFNHYLTFMTKSSVILILWKILQYFDMAFFTLLIESQ